MATAVATAAPDTATAAPDTAGDIEVVAGVACRTDPMERLQCDSCQ